MSIHSDMEILSDMLNGEESPYGNIIEVDQELSYYNGFGIELTKQIKYNLAIILFLCLKVN